MKTEALLKIKSMFDHPPKEYRPAPFYFLNHKLERDGIAVKLNDQLVDVRIWPSFGVDITESLLNRQNTLQLEVFNSL
jgi:uncharacterized alkaline shock family protein YloU